MTEKISLKKWRIGKFFYRESPHKTVKWETEYTVLCEIVLFQIENRDIAKNSTM